MGKYVHVNGEMGWHETSAEKQWIVQEIASLDIHLKNQREIYRKWTQSDKNRRDAAVAAVMRQLVLSKYSNILPLIQKIVVEVNAEPPLANKWKIVPKENNVSYRLRGLIKSLFLFIKRFVSN